MSNHNDTPEHQGREHDGHGHHSHEQHERSFTITVKTLAGHALPVEVIGSELVAAVAIEATIEFRAKHELANDDATYALSLPRMGPSGSLDPTSTLLAAGVHAHDELFLISRAPHVDGS